MRPARLTVPRPCVAIVLAGFVVFGGAGMASAQAPNEQTIFPRTTGTHESHARAHAVIVLGAGLTATSFAFSSAADRAYRRYQDGSDPAQIERDFRAARRDDRLSAGFLLAGTGALALGVYWRFIHHAPGNAARVGVAPSITPRHAGLALRVALP